MENSNNQNRPIQTRRTENKKSGTVSANSNRGASTAAIITLSILLGLSLILGLTAAFFSASQSATGDITLGNPVNITITQGGASVEALTFAGDAMPGTSYSQPIGISVPSETSQAVLRCKLTLANTQTAASNVEATTSEDWISAEDGYYYYNGSVNAGDTLDFCSAITVPTTLTNSDANKVFTITFQVEAIQYANGAAAEVWTTAPQEWITAYGSGS